MLNINTFLNILTTYDPSKAKYINKIEVNDLINKLNDFYNDILIIVNTDNENENVYIISSNVFNIYETYLIDNRYDPMSKEIIYITSNYLINLKQNNNITIEDNKGGKMSHIPIYINTNNQTHRATVRSY